MATLTLNRPRKIPAIPSQELDRKAARRAEKARRKLNKKIAEENAKNAAIRRAERHANLHEWLMQFPAFSNCLPLAIGIYNQIPERPQDKLFESLSKYMAKYTSSHEYLSALSLDGSWRHNLDGSPSEPVSEFHRELARSKLDAM